MKKRVKSLELRISDLRVDVGEAYATFRVLAHRLGRLFATHIDMKTTLEEIDSVTSKIKDIGTPIWEEYFDIVGIALAEKKPDNWYVQNVLDARIAIDTLSGVTVGIGAICEGWLEAQGDMEKAKEIMERYAEMSKKGKDRDPSVA